MKAKTIDEKFDNSEDILDAFDLSKAIRPNQKQKRVNVDFPTWMVASLDKEARHLNGTKSWLGSASCCVRHQKNR